MFCRNFQFNYFGRYTVCKEFEYKCSSKLCLTVFCAYPSLQYLIDTFDKIQCLPRSWPIIEYHYLIMS